MRPDPDFVTSLDDSDLAGAVARGVLGQCLGHEPAMDHNPLPHRHIPQRPAHRGPDVPQDVPTNPRGAAAAKVAEVQAALGLGRVQLGTPPGFGGNPSGQAGLFFGGQLGQLRQSTDCVCVKPVLNQRQKVVAHPGPGLVGGIQIGWINTIAK